MIVVRPLEVGECEEVIALLAEAFADDIGMSTLLGGRMQALGPWFAATLSLLAPPAGTCLVAHDGASVCGVILTSTPTGPGVWRQVVWTARVGLAAGLDVLLRTARHDQARRGHNPGASPVVEFVAVDPARRGQGIARQMFDAVHALGRQQWLETTKPENLPIFGRLGYREMSRRVELGVTYFAMERSVTP